MEKQTNTPKLRFPEFKGEWEKKKLGELCKMQAGKFINASEIFENIDDKFYPCFGGNGIRGYAKVYNHEGKYSLIGRQGALCGNINLANGKFYATEHAVVVNLFKGLDTDFMYYVLNNLNLNKYSTGLAQPGLSIQNLEKVEDYIFPTLPEQTRIASFFTSIDKKIAEFKQKKTLLEQYKKGIMQKLFSQELRFKDENGKDFPEWEKKKLGNISEIKTGNKDTQNREKDGLYPFFVRSDTVERINSYSYDGEAILTSGDGVGVGKNYHYIKGKFDFHQRVYSIRNFGQNVSGKFIFYYFSTYFNDRVKRVSAKNSVDSVRLEMISEMPISVPSFEEQTKIANFLSAIDEKINHTENQIQKTQEWKKGLLQRMFC
jgi:type I restriction enzyme S subunit